MITLLALLQTTALAHPNHTQDWENWDNIELCQTEHEQCHAIFEASPKATRNPSIQRFSDPNLKDAKWTRLHIQRLKNPDEPLETRLALLDLVAHSKGDWEAGVLFLLEDPAPEMRVLLVQSTKFASADFALKVFPALAKDEDPAVRTAVYRNLRWNEVDEYRDLFISGLQDENEQVQLSAIRGIGWNRIPVNTELLTPFLAHENPELRLYSLRTIHRINPTEAKSLPQLKSLVQDSNEKVAREAKRISKGNIK